MTQKEIDKLMLKIDKKCKFPKHWIEFIEKRVKQNNFITKDTKNKNFHCLGCQHNFYDKNLKIGDFTICPKCNKKYYIYSINSRGYNYIDNVILVQRINKQIVIRIFEIWTFYNKEKQILDYSVQEYARYLPGIGRFINNHVEFHFTGMYVYHYDMDEYWRTYNGVRLFTHYDTYPFNKRKLIKGTILEYAPINECLEKYRSLNFLDVIMIASNKSFELLWNMKLYSLALNSRRFNKEGSFYKRFGVPKDYLKFMQDNNISYTQLRFLKLLKQKNIELLDKIKRWNYNGVKFLYDNNILEEYVKTNEWLNSYTIDVLKDIRKFVDLKRLKNYPQALEHLTIYRDYLNACKKLEIKLISKNSLFPADLIKTHDEIMAKLNSFENGEKNLEILPVYLKLSKYTYDDGKYIIYPATSVESMKEEGRQQNNCVGNMYVDAYSKGTTEIYFIRKLKDPLNSLITLEYKDGVVVQKELSNHNKNLTEEQNNFINKWLEYRNFIELKEKVKAKTKIKSKKYNISSLAA